MARHLRASVLLQRHAGLSPVQARLGVSDQVRVSAAVRCVSWTNPFYGYRLTKKALGTYLDDGDETKSGQVFYKLGKYDLFLELTARV
jgi:hypothetical protein